VVEAVTEVVLLQDVEDILVLAQDLALHQDVENTPVLVQDLALHQGVAPVEETILLLLEEEEMILALQDAPDHLEDRSVLEDLDHHCSVFL
jgi:hypothetical protein